MKVIDLSIIIVSYNTKEFLKSCLKSILDSIVGKLSYEVIIVDNASTDGTIEEVQNSILRLRDAPSGASLRSGQEFKVQSNLSTLSSRPKGSLKLKVIQNKENVGFSRANNIGVKQAKGRYLLFLNPDTIVYPNTLETMVDFMDKHKEAGAATCRVILPNGELDDASHRGFPTPWNSFTHFSTLEKIFPKSRLFGKYSLGWMDRNSIHEIDACAGAFMIVRREAGDEAGWWDEDYFFYGEDLDFCYRLKHGLSIYSSRLGGARRYPLARTINKKWKIYYVPTVSILHYKGVSGGIKKISKDITTADKDTKERAMSERFEAMRTFYKKHYLKKYPPLIMWLVFCGIKLKLWFASKKF